MNTYVFCLSEHDADNTDGLLSMWRAYGGQGSGAALVFNTRHFKGHDLSPLAIAKVRYLSAREREAQLRERIEKWITIIGGREVPEGGISVCAYVLFAIIKVLALTIKHRGFSEEREWRLIYMPDRDLTNGLLQHFYYAVGNRGVEPKLKLKISPELIDPAATWNFDDVVEKIILGPTVSSPLSRASFCRMLEVIGKANFAPRVSASEIPLRPQ